MNRIKQLREEFDFSQNELAKKLGGAPSTVAMYEKGERKPSMEVLIKLSEIFNCSIDYLLGLSNYRNEGDFFKHHVEETKHFLEFRLPQEFSEEDVDIFIDKIEKEPKESFEKKLKIFLLKYPEELKERIEGYIRFMYDYSNNLGIQEEQEFRYAYHKETEGMTDEEIKDALRFYKEMKKKVQGNNNGTK